MNYFSNTYNPPAIKASIIKHIEKHEFVDFPELLPPIALPPSHTILTSDSQPSNKKPETPPITNFQTWVMAWNNFYQTKLHFNPNIHSELFTYFKLITEFSVKFKFSVVIAYDKAHRLKLASQAHLPSEHHTTTWRKMDDELFNLCTNMPNTWF